MKKMIRLLPVFLLLALTPFITCKKESTTTDTTDEAAGVAGEAFEAQTAVSTTCNLVIANAATKDDILKSALGSCPTLTSTPATGYPKTHTLDFGTAGCAFGGATIYGKIIALASSKILQTNTQITVTFDAFKVDTTSISGTISMKVNSYTLIGTSLSITATFTNLILTTPSGSITVSGSSTLVWKINGTPTVFDDDVIDVQAGSTLTGTGRKGSGFTANVKTTITFKTSCMEPVQGTLEVIPAKTTLGTTTVDCGNGTCDGKVTITTLKGTSTKNI